LREKGMFKLYSTMLSTYASAAIQSAAVLALPAFWAEIKGMFFDLRWTVLFVVVLIVTDFLLGTAESTMVRHERFRRSTAMRKSLIKFCEYICFIILTTVLARCILVPLHVCDATMGGVMGAVLVLLIEFDSICGHVCVLHGLNVRFSFRRFLVSLLKHKSRDIGEAVEDALEEKDSRSVPTNEATPSAATATPSAGKDIAEETATAEEPKAPSEAKEEAKEPSAAEATKETDAKAGRSVGTRPSRRATNKRKARKERTAEE